MNVRNTLQWIVAILTIAMGMGGGYIFAAEVYTYGGNFNLPIPAESDTTKGWMADAVIEISDHFTIDDLDVALTLTHTSAFDLQIFLQSPAGTTICLNMYDIDDFFTGQNYTQTIFDDQAQIPIEQADPPFTGRFKPKQGNLLAAFNNQDCFGPWHLQIYDAFYDDTGTLNSFELLITNPEPATVILLTLGTAMITLLKPNRKS